MGNAVVAIGYIAEHLAMLDVCLRPLPPARTTDRIFDAQHPNPEHVPGVLYNPLERCVFIDTPRGMMRGDISDWIVQGLDGGLYPVRARGLRHDVRTGLIRKAPRSEATPLGRSRGEPLLVLLDRGLHRRIAEA